MPKKKKLKSIGEGLLDITSGDFLRPNKKSKKSNVVDEIAEM